MRVGLLESAHEDIVDAYWFYERQQVGLGDYFSNSIYADLESLAFFAGTHRQVFGYYKMLATRFPYSAYYRISNDVVQVFAVLENRCDPMNAAARLMD